MDAEEVRRRASSFGSVAKAYAENRPDYPTEAVGWLAGTTPTRVLELGSGTGKLTRALIALGHDVVATDPLTSMLGQLSRVAPAAHRAAALAEDIPLASGTVDVVVSAQAFHWFDTDRALPEIARVLKPGGVLANVWNSGDLKVPWVRKVFGLIGHTDEHLDDPLVASELFTTKERRVFRHWQRFDEQSLVGFIASSSYAAVRTPDEREALLGEVAAIYDSYGRGHDGMLMPWKATCFRAVVTDVADARRHDAVELDDGLLIDFG